MPNLGKMFLFAMIQLFVLKAVCTGILPILKSDQQLWVLEESQENEESDDSFELKFIDEFIALNHAIDLFDFINVSSSKRAYSSYNAALFIGFKNESFRPPCA
ncbi:MAG: hypothetical protein RIR94_1751 [Bacteroidota bacterium]